MWVGGGWRVAYACTFWSLICILRPVMKIARKQMFSSYFRAYELPPTRSPDGGRCLPFPLFSGAFIASRWSCSPHPPSSNGASPTWQLIRVEIASRLLWICSTVNTALEKSGQVSVEAHLAVWSMTYKARAPHIHGQGFEIIRMQIPTVIHAIWNGEISQRAT